MGQQHQHAVQQQYARARKARDARFDGVFFIAVKTTGIYCRPICPANSPLEKNVEYYDSAVAAAKAGYRPCLRCRPDSAPQSWAWMGSETSFQRAIKLINQGELQTGSIKTLSSRLGISDRYLRELFDRHLGVSPKKYAIYQQCLFAKQLLHQSSMPITDIAFAAGFKSVRRFNEAMIEHIGLSPSSIRKSNDRICKGLELRLCYRPPFDWLAMLSFLERRLIPDLEWVSDGRYGRTIRYLDSKGYFELGHAPKSNSLSLTLRMDKPDYLNAITQRIRTLFDTDAPITEIDQQLGSQLASILDYQHGLRIPGIWGVFEAGVRAVLGQQVSVLAAQKLVSLLVAELGEKTDFVQAGARAFFPTAEAVLNSDLGFFRMPQSRKDTLHRLAEHMLVASDPSEIDDWLSIKGIGPWTVNYVKMRYSKDPDVWLAGDAGLKNALATIESPLETEQFRPWRSYLTFQLWSQL